MGYKNFRKFVRFLYRRGQRQQKCSPVKKNPNCKHGRMDQFGWKETGDPAV